MTKRQRQIVIKVFAITAILGMVLGSIMSIFL